MLNPPKVLLTGVHSQICQQFLNLVPDYCECVELTSEQCNMNKISNILPYKDLIVSCDYFVLAHGILMPKTFKECTEEEIIASLQVNLLSMIQIIELALENPFARIVVMGSDSATKGSYDTAYWLSKAALHAYVREKKLAPRQQLVCVAPSMIMNTGMTNQKPEKLIQEVTQANPKKRGLEPHEVARTIAFLLFEDQGYITNTVIEMNGGKFARCG